MRSTHEKGENEKKKKHDMEFLCTMRSKDGHNIYLFHDHTNIGLVTGGEICSSYSENWIEFQTDTIFIFFMTTPI
jgi:hypothetical protein